MLQNVEKWSRVDIKIAKKKTTMTNKDDKKNA
jgi:hypothetical protein